MRKHFVDSVGVLASWFSIICAKECIVPDIYDPTLNPLFRDVLAHYGAVAMPCRIQDPDRKGKVESGVGHAKKTPLKGLRFESLEEAQAYLDHWEAALGRYAHPWHDETAGRGHVRRGKAVPASSAARTLPLLPIRRTRRSSGRLRRSRSGLLRSCRPAGSDALVKVQWDALHVRILHPPTNELLREHLRQKRGWYRIKNEDYPKKMPFSTAQLLRRAGRAGAQIGVLCDSSISSKESLAFAASWAFSPWPRNTAWRLWKMPAPPLSRSACRSIASCAVISSAAHS